MKEKFENEFGRAERKGNGIQNGRKERIQKRRNNNKERRREGGWRQREERRRDLNREDERSFKGK